jgi:uncharacterized membrane protein
VRKLGLRVAALVSVTLSVAFFCCLTQGLRLRPQAATRQPHAAATFGPRVASL